MLNTMHAAGPQLSGPAFFEAPADTWVMHFPVVAPEGGITRRERRFSGTVKETMLSSPATSKPNRTTARAPSVARPRPQ